MESMSSLPAAIALNPKYEYAWYNRGMALTNLERYQEAIAALDQTLQINPHSKDAPQNRDSLIRKVSQVPRTNAM
jgi:tetratricopeptide (TPR) repeat protein